MRNHRWLVSSGVALLAGVLLAACQARPAPVTEEPVLEPASEPAEALAPQAYVVDVVAEDYAFQAPQEIPSGWITFRMTNEGEETHFMYLTRVTGGHSYDQYVSEVLPPIADVLARQRAGELTKAEAGQEFGAMIPPWYWENAAPRGGPGLVAAGGVSQGTVRLEPGLYVMECFMKTPEGEVHWAEGMIRPITVTEEESGASAPEADIQIMVMEDEFIMRGPLTPGVHTVAVTFQEHPEVGFGNDVHLARLEDGMEAEDLLPWMDFLNIEGLQNPAPTVFFGGMQERPEGHTAYFTVELEPGRYVWISEGPDVRGMVQEFTVPR